MDLAAPLARTGRYEVVRRLGGGGMGDVFLARRRGPRGFARLVALKVIRPDLSSEPRMVELFLREGTVLAALAHRNIVQVHELDQEDGQLYLAMEYLRGINLRRLAAAQGGRLPWDVVAWIGVEVARGLQAAHELTLSDAPTGVIHRDLSPSNVMVCRDGAVKILDFGLARPAGQMPSTSAVEGKLVYLGPECLAGLALDARVDVYALAVVLYELLAGAQPFAGDDPLALMRAIAEGDRVPLSARGVAVPAALEQALARGMARDRGLRHATARELGQELAPLAAGVDADRIAALVAAAWEDDGLDDEDDLSTVPARPPRAQADASSGPVTESASQAPHRRHRLPWLLAGVGLVAGAAAAIIAVSSPSGAPVRSPGASSPPARAVSDPDPVADPDPDPVADPDPDPDPDSDPVAGPPARRVSRSRKPRAQARRTAPRPAEPKSSPSPPPPEGAPPGTLLDPFPGKR